MPKKVLEFYCKACYVYQEWRGQDRCTHCGAKLSRWHVAKQVTTRPQQSA
jgi:rRNA maturation endonuclease Nob1